ncbi:MAG: hypothetical protein K6G38_06450 [Gammaproteobacteria bacterium]|nr:hypothetical protein [Gammaproteobacteria bacterium]
MTIKEVNEMRRNGLDKCEKGKLLDAYTIVNATKNTFADLEKEIKETLESKMEVGEQLSLDFGSNTFTSSMVNVDDIGFDCSDEDLYSIASSCANMYCTHSVNKTEMKKDYKKGTLHPDLIKHVTITTQATMKITKKAKKEED